MYFLVLENMPPLFSGRKSVPSKKCPPKIRRGAAIRVVVGDGQNGPIRVLFIIDV